MQHVIQATRRDLGLYEPELPAAVKAHQASRDVTVSRALIRMAYLKHRLIARAKRQAPEFPVPKWHGKDAIDRGTPDMDIVMGAIEWLQEEAPQWMPKGNVQGIAARYLIRR